MSEELEEFISPAARRAGIIAGRRAFGRVRNPHPHRARIKRQHDTKALWSSGYRSIRSVGGPNRPHRNPSFAHIDQGNVNTKLFRRNKLFQRLRDRRRTGITNRDGTVYGLHGHRGVVQGKIIRVKKSRTRYKGSRSDSSNNIQRTRIHQHVRGNRRAMSESILEKVKNAKQKKTDLLTHGNHEIGKDVKPIIPTPPDTNKSINRASIQERKSLAATIRDLNNRNNK